MEIKIGDVLDAKVTGITKFGAFVSLPEGKSGLVHISEIANAYVSDVNDFLKVGDAVRVRVLSISEAGKINLSIKKAAETPPQAARPTSARSSAPQASRPVPPPDAPSADKAFEDRLKKFMQESDSRIADNRIYSERRQRSRRK